MNKRIDIKVKIIFIIVVAVIFFIVYKTLQVPDRDVHYHANFAVFVNDKQVDFSKDEFMHITPCGPDEPHEENEPDENVHLHDNIGNVVHVHHENVTWNDLFKNIKFDIRHVIAEQESKGVTAKYYLNGKISDDVLTRVIGKDEQLLVSIGSDKSAENVTGDTILKKQFEKVGTDAKEYDAGTKGKETCGGNGQRTFFERMKIAFGML